MDSDRKESYREEQEEDTQARIVRNPFRQKPKKVILDDSFEFDKYDNKN